MPAASTAPPDRFLDVSTVDRSSCDRAHIDDDEDIRGRTERTYLGQGGFRWVGRLLTWRRAVVGLLVLAEAFRRGEQLAVDVEGLV